MTQPAKRTPGRRWVAAVAVAVSLCAAASAAPAGAVDENSEQDHRALADACVGPALQDRSFADVSDDGVFFDAINCLAHYRITAGCGDGTVFCPDRVVTRWQMALFLRRAADVAGLDLPRSTVRGFADIPDTHPERWTEAINDLAAAGIMPGVSATEFNPDGMVARKDMALFLAGFLAAASDAVTRVDSGAQAGTYVLGPAADPPNDAFCDVSDGYPRQVQSAVSAIYELGVTFGRGPGTDQCSGEMVFDPEGLVERDQMAAVITRALGHTNARPAGVTAQAADGEITVSIRDDMHDPVAYLSVDAFYVPAGRESSAFDVDGRCTRVVAALGGDTACEIDGADPLTLTDGNVVLERIPSGSSDATVWVWAGLPGAVFHAATGHVKLSVTSQ